VPAPARMTFSDTRIPLKYWFDAIVVKLVASQHQKNLL